MRDWEVGDIRGWEVGEIEGNYAIKKGLKWGSNEKPMPYICHKWIRKSSNTDMFPLSMS